MHVLIRRRDAAKSRDPFSYVVYRVRHPTATVYRIPVNLQPKSKSQHDAPRCDDGREEMQMSQEKVDYDGISYTSYDECKPDYKQNRKRPKLHGEKYAQRHRGKHQAMRPFRETPRTKRHVWSTKAVRVKSMQKRSNIRLVKATHHISATQTIQVHELLKTDCRVVRDLLSRCCRNRCR